MIKLKDILKESSPGYENRQFGDPLPTLEDIAKKYQEKNGIKEESVNEAIISADKIDSRNWRNLKYDLRDQFDELAKIGADYGVFQNAQGTAKILKQIQRLMHKL
jgi:hypothetical protein|tara:strand:- start:226 stop:540 length:315 start_codon:yes stop_codon:yes gene_type:complete